MVDEDAEVEEEDDDGADNVLVRARGLQRSGTMDLLYWGVTRERASLHISQALYSSEERAGVPFYSRLKYQLQAVVKC